MPLHLVGEASWPRESQKTKPSPGFRDPLVTSFCSSQQRGLLWAPHEEAGVRLCGARSLHLGRRNLPGLPAAGDRNKHKEESGSPHHRSFGGQIPRGSARTAHAKPPQGKAVLGKAPGLSPARARLDAQLGCHPAGLRPWGWAPVPGRPCDLLGPSPLPLSARDVDSAVLSRETS